MVSFNLSAVSGEFEKHRAPNFLGEFKEGCENPLRLDEFYDLRTCSSNGELLVILIPIFSSSIAITDRIFLILFFDDFGEFSIQDEF